MTLYLSYIGAATMFAVIYQPAFAVLLGTAYVVLVTICLAANYLRTGSIDP